MNDKLIKEIEDEMAICKVRIHEARVEIAKLNERQLNYDDRLTMLQNLFLIAKEREENETGTLGDTEHKEYHLSPKE